MNDLRFALRGLRKNPGFAATAMLTLALAIGANAAVFSLVDAVLLKPLPYPNPDRLALVSRVGIRNGVRVGEDISHTGAVWEAVRDHAATIDVAALSGISARVSLVSAGTAVPVEPQRVSAGYFHVLGVPPAIGREFTAEEDRAGGPPVAILSDRLWRSLSSGDPALVGQTILLKGEPHEVIGVMPPSFRSDVDADLWTPLRPSRNGEGGGNNYGIVARLRDGASWAKAEADVMAAADQGLTRRTSDSGTSWTHSLMPLQKGLTSEVERPLTMLWAAVGLVLLVACVNLAGLLLARAGRRTREIATRLAIGGDRRLVIRQLLVESLVLAVCGGVLGLAFGAAALEGLKALAGNMLTAWGNVQLDGRVLAVTAALTLLTSLVFGLVPALHATRIDVQAALAEGGTRSVAGGSRGWPRRLLVMAEVALGVVLLVGAGLLLRTFMNLQAMPTGFDPANLITASASLEDARYNTHDSVSRLFDESLARLRAIPGVESAALSLGLPYKRILNMGARVAGPGGKPEGDWLFTTLTYVTPGYFETLRLPVQRGRLINDRDTATSVPVIVVSETFARRYFKSRDAVGSHVVVGGAAREIVGIVANVPQEGGFNGYGPIDALPMIYMSFAQFPGEGLRMYHTWFSPAWILRTAPSTVVGEPVLRQAIAQVDAQLPLTAVRGVADLRGEALSRQRLLMTLISMLAAAALLLAAIGIHGLIASGVAERTRELGIRMALGSTVAQAVRTVAWPGIGLSLVGLGIGGVAAYGVSGLIRSQLWGVSADDPVTFIAVAATLFAVAVAASILPALRVRKLDPVALLRE